MGRIRLGSRAIALGHSSHALRRGVLTSNLQKVILYIIDHILGEVVKGITKIQAKDR